MLPKWTEYIKKFDTFAEYAFLSCCKNTLNEFYLMLHGKNNMSPDPVITLNVNLREKKVESNYRTIKKLKLTDFLDCL